jgi:isopentenyl-diphosphate delta-isomerase type 1
MEYIDVVDKDGNKTGQSVSRKEIHEKGFWHKSVHVWFVNSKKEILLQLRSENKREHPGWWDISVAGHMSAGDDEVTAAIREAKEEIGLDIDAKELKFIGTVHQEATHDDYINKEINPVFVVQRDLDLTKLKIQEEEVSELKYVPFDLFVEMTKDTKSKLLKHGKEFEILIAYINTEIK